MLKRVKCNTYTQTKMALLLFYIKFNHIFLTPQYIFKIIINSKGAVNWIILS